jgi:PAS domain S-box-containing protein
VSARAAQLLGWSAAELEGQRLVAIVPPALRDAHVAGFTRQLLGGAQRIGGEGVRVPALRRDGSQVEVDLEIDREMNTDGHPVFVATLAPVTD